MEAEYQKVISDENYPVIFGTVHIGLNNDIEVRSARGTRKQEHGDFGYELHLENASYTWRFVPLTNTCYWWESGVSLLIKEEVEHNLRRRFKITGRIKHKSIPPFSERESIGGMVTRMTSHPTEYAYASKDKLPSFAQWYKYHQGD